MEDVALYEGLYYGGVGKIVMGIELGRMKELILGPLECAAKKKFVNKIGCNEGVSKPAGMACIPTGKAET